MNLLSILYFLLIRPLELIYELIFSLSYKFTGSAVLSIVFLSITVGLLCLPLYTRADALQAEANAIEKKLKPWKTEIKKNFKGDEQVMMLQAYYRENNYHPLMMMRSSISLLLQIPFFISAYHMLSSSVALQGTSFGPIADLGEPDGIIKIGAFAINLLPILMTAINIISGTIYSKGLDKKAKIQLYVTALVFLVLLYNSPSGLVLYWTLNNVFSLIKNIVMKLVPASKKPKADKTYKKDKNDTINFVLYSLSISVFIGILIPSDLIARAVGDFLTNYRTIHMPHYIWVSFFICLGFFFVWGGIYFFIVKNRKLIAGIMVALTAFALINYFAFYRNNGDLNRYLYIRTFFNDEFMDGAFNLVVFILAAVLIFIVMRHKSSVFKYLGIVAIVGVTAVSVVNMQKIYEVNASYSYIENQREYPEITLSQNGQNVVVIMLDRAVGRVTPFIMEELPELYEEFDGFTYYSNSLSYGLHTNMGAPALFGGYEYSPARLNARSDESLQDKHNEALRVLPVVFGENGYDVTVLDPSFAGYSEIPNLSIYDEYSYVKAYITNGIMNPFFEEQTDDWNDFMERNLFIFSLRLASPMWVRGMLYDDGYYNDLNRRLSGDSYTQIIIDASHAEGLNFDYLNSSFALVGLPEITTVDTSNDVGSFVLMANDSTHEPTLLSEPDYTISRVVDNSAYDQANSGRFSLNDMTLYPDSAEMMGQYQIQAAAFEMLGNWFDQLREQGVYDNTRIIIVSDHGAPFCLFGDNGVGDGLNVCNFNCLMMVKDFGATGFNVCDDFIMNADTPAIAVSGIIDEPVNPFTGAPIVSELDNAQSFRYFSSEVHNVTQNNGNTFVPGDWYSYDPSVGDIYDLSGWSYLGYQ